MPEKKVSPGQLKPGMYVSSLDRPWIETPFLLQGFLIQEEADVDEVKAHCKYVFIDVERGEDTDGDVIADSSSQTPEEDWADQTETKLELPEARKCVEGISTEIAAIFEAAKAGGGIHLAALKEKVLGLVDSALRNVDASMLLARLRIKDNYTYNHALCVSILAVALGKRLGFDKEELQTLALSASLFDIGKMQVPDPLLHKTEQLSRAEWKVIQRHVESGVKILSETDVDPLVIDVAQNHHERFDSKGYPAGKQGSEISMFAQIVGLVDAYDAMVSNRIYRAALSHDAAVQQLYELRGSAFQADMLEQFIQCLGTYPAGSLVALTTGEVGIVIQQNGIRRLRPQVMLVLNSDKQPLDHFPIINLLNELEDRNGYPLAIASSLEPGAHGIDPAEYFL